MCDVVGRLFDEEPNRWGLRGDPYMWKDLQERFSRTPLPDSSNELEKLIKDALYATIANEALERRRDPQDSKYEYCWIERFSHGGMSSGGISTKFWETKAIPMLVERFEQHRASQERNGNP
ncbi:hypothetical protein ACU19_02915 [Actinobaculum suis]|uniref:hypothetical protein n=1 Tax=Actinobaculum suis TaxID=1657 RepID=UPI0006A17B1A|nr:hypothetical protein [Actinobaculum suis]KMY23626.1 hypothetical protein ACU19_02915 [Actinobaculum suis]